MAKRWTAECDDAATLAKAILSGVVTDSKESFDRYFGTDGPAEEIGDKYNFHTVKGKRNLRLNCKKLLEKIALWKSNQKGSDGKCEFYLIILFWICRNCLVSSYFFRRPIL